MSATEARVVHFGQGRGAAPPVVVCATSTWNGLASSPYQTWAFRRAEMSAILPLESTKLIWSVSYGWIFFSEQPQVLTLLGGLVIFSAAAYITIREAQIAHRTVPIALGPEE